MIQATARVLQNIVEIQVGEVLWTARPVASTNAPIARQISALFSTTYQTFHPSEPTTVRSTVSYHAKKDEITIQVGERKWRTRSSTFGPLSFEYADQTYQIHEKLTGRFAIFLGEKMVGQGRVGFRSCTIDEYPADLEAFLADLALGYLDRTLFWEMFK